MATQRASNGHPALPALASLCVNSPETIAALMPLHTCLLFHTPCAHAWCRVVLCTGPPAGGTDQAIATTRAGMHVSAPLQACFTCSAYPHPHPPAQQTQWPPHPPAAAPRPLPAARGQRLRRSPAEGVSRVRAAPGGPAQRLRGMPTQCSSGWGERIAELKGVLRDSRDHAWESHCFCLS